MQVKQHQHHNSTHMIANMVIDSTNINGYRLPVPLLVDEGQLIQDVPFQHHPASSEVPQMVASFQAPRYTH